MSVSDPAELAVRIEEAVRAVPAVTSVFRAGSLAANALAAAATALTGAVSAPRAVVREGESGLEVEVSIGVGTEGGLRETLRQVHTAIARTLDEEEIAERDVRVTVAHISG